MIDLGGYKVKLCPNPDCCSPHNLELHRRFEYVCCKSCGTRGPVTDGHPEDSVLGWNDLPRNPDRLPPRLGVVVFVDAEDQDHLVQGLSLVYEALQFSGVTAPVMAVRAKEEHLHRISFGKNGELIISYENEVLVAPISKHDVLTVPIPKGE